MVNITVHTGNNKGLVSIETVDVNDHLDFEDHIKETFNVQDVKGYTFTKRTGKNESPGFLIEIHLDNRRTIEILADTKEEASKLESLLIDALNFRISAS